MTKVNCFTYLTNIDVLKGIKEIVSIGRNFCTNLLPNTRDVCETIINVESVLNVLEIDHSQKLSIRHKIVNHIWVIRNSSACLTRIDQSVRQKINATKEFSREKEKIFFTLSDKGNRSVCMEKSVHVAKC